VQNFRKGAGTETLPQWWTRNPVRVSKSVIRTEIWALLFITHREEGKGGDRMVIDVQRQSLTGKNKKEEKERKEKSGKER